MMASKVIKGTVARILRGAGWTPDRDSPAIAEAFRLGRGQDLFPQAESFVRHFGGIEVGGRLWIFEAPHEGHFLTSFESRISKIVNARVVPVAGSIYLSDTCIIWLDEHERFYAADSDGMTYLGEGVAKFFEVVLLETPPQSPPTELQERLQGTYEWEP